MRTDAAFDELMEEIRMRDDTPRPAFAFVHRLESALVAPGPRTIRPPSRAVPVGAMPPPRRLGAEPVGRMRWTALAATIALLLATAGGGYLTGIAWPGDDDPATNIAAPMTGSPIADSLVTPARSPAAVERTVGSCESRKSYMSSVGGQMLIQSPQTFGQDAFNIDRMQLQHWSFGPGLNRAFPASEMAAIDGMVMDTVTNGVYTATFEGPVVVSTFYGAWLSSWVSTPLTSTVNTVELGVGESVLFQAGTAHEIVNDSGSRGLGVERLILYSGDGSGLVPPVESVDRPAEAILSHDTETDGRAGITVRPDGTGTIEPGDAPPGWRNALITIEFVISLDDPLTVLVPGCESPETRQVRNVDEMFNAVPPPIGEPETDQYIGYLVWIGEGGRG